LFAAPSRRPDAYRRIAARRRCLASFVSCLAILGPWPLAEAQLVDRRPESRRDESPLVPPRVGLVDRTRSSMPEWLAMLVEVLAGGQVAPGRGWFEKGVSRTRFGWEPVAARLDRDRDGSIVREEYPGPEADFRRLDRDRSGKLNPADFDFPANALARSRSRMILSFADRDKDGKVAGEEYDRMVFLAARDELTRQRYFADAIEEVVAAHEDSGRKGIPFLGLSDFRETVDLAAARKGLEVIPNPDGETEVATRSTLVKALLNRDIGSPRPGPSPGDRGPDFTLPTDDGRARVTLSKLVGPRPVVLVFASSTDAAFRGEAGSLEKLFRLYRDRAEFLLVYVRESRPSDGWASRRNALAGVALAQPTEGRTRARAAQDCRRRLGLGWPTVVDSMDDRVGILYSGMPDRIYLLDTRGNVAYRSGRGPFGFKPDELEQSLILLLQAGAAPAAGPPDPGPPTLIEPRR